MIGALPRAIDLDGTMYPIRTDFRDILTILVAFSDPELRAEEKVFTCLYILYEDFSSIPKSLMETAYQKAVSFIDMGSEPKKGRSPRLMDWEQDERLIFPAINKVAGFETRSREYLHWWTFMGYFMEISDGTYSQVLSLRNKKNQHKKLEKWEQEFWRRNKDICVLKPKVTEAEKKEKDRLNALLG